jgi:effector-binding domain-containing protein
MVETAKYDVIMTEDKVEIRFYHKMLLATIESSSNSLFNILFRYISGANKSSTKISMTSPVITSEKIPMTSPVISGSDSMSFVIPQKYNIETVPKPTDKRVSIKEIPEKYVATIKFRGVADKNSVNKQSEKLLKWVSDKNIEAKDSPFLMQYNPPYIPVFLRRNEIGIEINYNY